MREKPGSAKKGRTRNSELVSIGFLGGTAISNWLQLQTFSLR